MLSASDIHLSPPMSSVLFLPSQVLTIEQANSRVQNLFEIYREDNKKLTSWTLPPTRRKQFSDAFEQLLPYVEALESGLTKLAMFFSDEVISNVVAIIVCAHRQHDLLYNLAVPEPRYVLPLSMIQRMTLYLDAVAADFYRTSLWVASVEGRHQRTLVNEAILKMECALRAFMPPFHDDENFRHNFLRDMGNRDGRWDDLLLSADNDLHLLLCNFQPLTCSRDEILGRTSWCGPEMYQERSRLHRSSSVAPLQRFMANIDNLFLPSLQDRPSSSPLSEASSPHASSPTLYNPNTAIHKASPIQGGTRRETAYAYRSAPHASRKRRRGAENLVSEPSAPLVPFTAKRIRRDTSSTTIASSRRMRRTFVSPSALRLSCSLASRKENRTSVDTDSGFEDQSSSCTSSSLTPDDETVDDTSSVISIKADVEKITTEPPMERPKKASWLETFLSRLTNPLW